MSIRSLQKKDAQEIHNIVTATKVFSKEEIDIADELVEIVLTQPSQKDYEIFVYVDEKDIAKGYICIGPTPATQGTYDLYWIATEPSLHNKGIGTQLLEYVENYLRKKNGRLLIAETSSTSPYEMTRMFYTKKGFQCLACIEGYYKPNDALLIYGKYL